MAEKEESNIRWYKEGDYGEVEELVRNLARIFDDPFEPTWFKLYMQKRLMEPIPGVYVAIMEKKVVGSIFCDVLRDPTGAQYGYISNIMINKDCRGKGIGEKLLKAAVQYLTIAGVQRIWGNVREETMAMVHLFEKNGFKKKFTTYELKTPPFGI
nr:GNAT family N-acetyltransferase [Candidatus Sigynarchaeota archaeon]